MGTTNKRYSVSPEPKLLAVLGLDPTLPGKVGGVTSAALAGAIARYADLFHEAARECGKEFPHRREWDFFAEVLSDTEFPALDDEFPAHLSCADAIERAHRYPRRAGDRWLIAPHERDAVTLAEAGRRVDERVKAIVGQLRQLTAVHGAVILAGVRWYWAHQDELKGTALQWWQPRDRQKWYERRETDAKAIEDAADSIEVKPSQQPLFTDEDE